MRHHVLAALAGLLTLIAAGFAVRAPAWPVAFMPPESAPECIGRPVFEIDTFHVGQRHAHAISAVMLRDGRIRAVWYEGTNELNPDVRIWSATYDGSLWSKPRVIVSPAETSAGTGRFVRKVGNAVVFRDPGGALTLVFATSLAGGWDGVNLKLTHSQDEGETWSPPRNLTTSPIFNLGTNVRGPAVPARGDMTIVPASREFLGTFPELILLDSRGRVVGKRRIGRNFKARQPYVSVRDEKNAIALMRTREPLTMNSKTADAGNSWTDLVPTNVPNFETPVSVVRIGRDIFAIASIADPSTKLWSLSFAVSSDEGQTWRDLYSQRFGRTSRDVPKYPWMMVGPGGVYHALFTLTRIDGTSELLHARISRDWIAERGGPPCR